MTAVKLEIQRTGTDIPPAEVHLMPFHIEHTGKAPLSTYFRPSPAPARPAIAAQPTEAIIAPELEKLDLRSTDDTAKVETVDGQMDVDVNTATSQSESLSDTQPTTDAPNDHANQPPLEDGAGSERLVASFRGRSIHGLKVPLPTGYGGLVLRTLAADGGSDTQFKATPQSVPEAGKKKSVGKSAEEKKAAMAAAKERRAARRAGKGTAASFDPDLDNSADASVEASDVNQANDSVALVGNKDAQPSVPVNTLYPTGAFSSFVVWNPDIPVDEGRDEYLRTLTEWIGLAAEVRRLLFWSDSAVSD
jgi:hypothetical protein